MPKVIANIAMSLDGYVTGPGGDQRHGLGDAPELHAWVSERDAVDNEILEGATTRSGAVVMGRRLFDVVVELHIHLAPMPLGGGTRLLRPGVRQRYRHLDVRPSENPVHLAYQRA